ncbi:MAG: phytanoyl-CoA dioxygenase family protein [Halioglobus sp.]|nr:phytanoyl-CoA dioxygenase family protein [Halioglobus sp.]
MSTFDREEILAELREVGYAQIPGFLSAPQLAAVNSYCDEQLGQNMGRNNFEGHQTERIYTLVARDRMFQDIVEDPRVMALCDALLMPNYLLTASQAIVIGPGESPQPWHTDDSFYPIPRPRPMVSLSTIVAVDSFTAENGGTQVVPGSHLWDDRKVSGYYISGDHESDTEIVARLAEQAVPVVMDAGDCVVFAGTLLHRGGANNSNGTRRAFSNQYCQPWARPQENFFLAIPPGEVAKMSPKVQSLLGYSLHPPFMGQVTASHPLKVLEEGFVPPAYR